MLWTTTKYKLSRKKKQQFEKEGRKKNCNGEKYKGEKSETYLH